MNEIIGKFGIYKDLKKIGTEITTEKSKHILEFFNATYIPDDVNLQPRNKIVVRVVDKNNNKIMKCLSSETFDEALFGG